MRETARAGGGVLSEARNAVGTPARRRFKPYPAYKDSGVEWLGEIPTHWECSRLKRVLSVINGSTPQSGVADYWDGDIAWVTPEDLGDLDAPEILNTRRRITAEGYRSCGTSLVPAGSLVLSTRAPIGHLAIADVELCTNQGCRSLVFRRQSVRKFFYYELAAARPELESLGQGSTFRELAKGKLEEVVISDPPEAEQRAIAAFLDRETARIDELVAKKERLIELLQEKRTALITRAVTKGLDPNVPMKDSGVEWLGEIPAHWGAGALARWWQVIDCKHRTVPFLDEGIALASIGEVQALEVNLSAAKRTAVEEYRQMISGGREPSRGDIIYSRNATVGAAALVTTDEPFCMGQDVSLIRAADRDQGFLLFLLRSPAVMGQLDAAMVGSTFNRINVSKIKSLAVCVPPLEEQREIAGFCHQEHKNTQQMTDKIRTAIDRLKELRTALISAAVTGKIDVREHAA